MQVNALRSIKRRALKPKRGGSSVNLHSTVSSLPFTASSQYLMTNLAYSGTQLVTRLHYLFILPSALTSRRHLSRSSRIAAKLLDPHVSITPGQVNQFPPTAPLPLSTSSSSITEKRKGTKLQPPTRPTQSTSSNIYPDIGATVAFDLFLLRVINQLGREQAPTLSLSAVLEQSNAKSGKQLDYPLAYESTPSSDRRVQPTAPKDKGSGIVVVAHVIGGQDPLVAVCSGFAIGPSHGPVQILTCLHTLNSVSS